MLSKELGTEALALVVGTSIEPVVHQGEVISNKLPTNKLPHGLKVSREIREMVNGESGYTVPWALDVTYDGTCFLRPTYTLHNTPGGTVKMRVTKTKNGYEVEVPENYEFDRSEQSNGIPVYNIKVSKTHRYF